MKRLAIAVIIWLFLSGCVTMKTDGRNSPPDNNAPIAVVIVGGAKKGDWVYLEPFREGIAGAIAIVPNRMWPVPIAAEELCRQIRVDKKIKGKVIIVAGSWAGLTARKMDALYPGMVAMIVAIGSPSGEFGPDFVKSWLFFDAGDKESDTPLYLIAGYDDSSPRRFYMSSGRNDGILDLKAVLNLGERRISGQRVFPGLRHMDLFMSPEVIRQVNSWIRQNQHRWKSKE